MTRWLAVAAIGCSSVTASDRAKTADYAIKALRAVCPYYAEGKGGVPKSPELDAVCPILLGEPVDAGSDAP